VLERRLGELERRCRAGLELAELQREFLRRLRQIVPVDAAFFATTDPATMLFTGALSEEPLVASAPRFLDNEIGGDDVNTFGSLAVGTDHVNSLDRATSDGRGTSERYREIMAPLGLGDELRAALVVDGRCWGVLCLHRADGSRGFDPDELDIVRRVVPHIAEGLRRAIAAGALPDAELEGARGVLILGADDQVVTANGSAERWLAEMTTSDEQRQRQLPIAVRAAVAHAGTVRLRTSRGTWVSVEATRLHGAAGAGEVAVVIEPASRRELASLFLDARGLTPAQSRVAALVLRGYSTQQIVNELHISSFTVQEHLRAVFDKFGVGSRRELVAALLS
jgi:DNA-binding CsgD family transcriptional regulator